MGKIEYICAIHTLIKTYILPGGLRTSETLTSFSTKNCEISDSVVSLSKPPTNKVTGCESPFSGKRFQVQF